VLPWSEPSRYRRYGRQPSEICLRSHGAHLTDASSIAVDAALRSYGIAGGAFRLTDAAHKVAKDPGSLNGGGRQARICDAQEDRPVISELNDLLMLHDERARVASGEVMSNIVALIPRYGVSALLLELPEAWRRALVT
jgi:hypothetical protein